MTGRAHLQLVAPGDAPPATEEGPRYLAAYLPPLPLDLVHPPAPADTTRRLLNGAATGVAVLVSVGAAVAFYAAVS